MHKYGLNISSGSCYDQYVNPSLLVEFNAAAYRVHSIVPGKVIHEGKPKNFGNMFVNAGPLYEGQMKSFLSQMAALPTEKNDKYFTKGLTESLYM